MLALSHCVQMQSMLWKMDVIQRQCVDADADAEAKKKQSQLVALNVSDHNLVSSTAQAMISNERKLWYKSLRTSYPMTNSCNSMINSCN